MLDRDAAAVLRICDLAAGRPVARLDPDAAADLIRVALQHGMASVIAAAPAAPDALPADALATLARHRRQAIAIDLLLSAENERLFAALTLPLLVVKGAAMHRYYGRPGLRPRCDTDLLVRASDAARAEEQLRDAGYEPELTSGGTVVRSQSMWRRVDALGLAHTVDLHWQLSNRARYSAAVSFDDLWSRAEPLGGRENVRVPSPADSLLIAALHLAGHHDDFERLIWLYDIHLLVRHAGEVRSRDARIDGIVTGAVARANALFSLGTSAAASRSRHPLAVAAEDFRHTRGYGRKLQFVREHLLPPPPFMLRRYNVRSRAWLPALYVARAASGMAKAVRRAFA